MYKEIVTHKIFIPVKLSYIIIGGGFTANQWDISLTSVEAFTGDFGKKYLPELPEDFMCCSLFVNIGTISSLGTWLSEIETCIQLDRGTWKVYGNANNERVCSATVMVKSATFIFGGESNYTYEYLPKDSKTWQVGKTKIPGGYFDGWGIAAKSEQEILLIGGTLKGKRILSFNVDDHTFKELPFHLNVERRGHRAALIPNSNKIMVTGGFNNTDHHLISTEVIDLATGTVDMGSPMKTDRAYHGMGMITFNDEERLAVFGGARYGKRIKYNLIYLDCVEVYNTHTESWEITDIKLSKPIVEFAFLNVKLGDIISQLKSSNE